MAFVGGFWWTRLGVDSRCRFSVPVFIFRGASWWLVSTISPPRQSNLEISTIFSASNKIIRDMSATDLIDHSPQQPEPVPPLASASNVVLIDNFDSFSWNIYQYLVLEGAKVTVFRNDEISIEKLAKLHPTQLVISPGPGHPKTDSGISRDAIKHFAGKIPVFGVCMGQFVVQVP